MSALLKAQGKQFGALLADEMVSRLRDCRERGELDDGAVNAEVDAALQKLETSKERLRGLGHNPSSLLRYQIACQKVFSARMKATVAELRQSDGA